jgi:protein-L-isoaspartate(D-aspartate) O-methyltransferase
LVETQGKLLSVFHYLEGRKGLRITIDEINCCWFTLKIFLKLISSRISRPLLLVQMEAQEHLRNHMVDAQLVPRGIHDQRVINAMRTVPRHEFVPAENRHLSYDDRPVPIGENQTISQPFIVAYMAQEAMISSSDNVLEIGTGCGYSASILACLCEKVTTIETIPSLAVAARERLRDSSNITCYLSDGTLGMPEHAPYDAIIVTAGAPFIPPSLVSQLAVNGRLVIPVHNEDKGHEDLLRVVKFSEENVRVEKLMDVMFVPLVGEQGWSS